MLFGCRWREIHLRQIHPLLASHVATDVSFLLNFTIYRQLRIIFHVKSRSSTDIRTQSKKDKLLTWSESKKTWRDFSMLLAAYVKLPFFCTHRKQSGGWGRWGEISPSNHPKKHCLNLENNRRRKAGGQKKDSEIPASLNIRDEAVWLKYQQN